MVAALRTVALTGTLLVLSFAVARSQGIPESTTHDEGSSTEGIEELIEYYRENPIDLAASGPQQLAQIPGISLQLADSITSFVATRHPTSIDELAIIEGVDEELLDLLESIARIGGDRSRPLDLELRLRASRRFETPRGAREDQLRIVERTDRSGRVRRDTITLGRRYIGPIGSYSGRLVGSSDRLSFSLLVDRDPGEPILYADSSRYTYRQGEVVGSDEEGGSVRRGLGVFLSGHLGYDVGPVRITLGDYRIAYGGGLLFAPAFGGSKGGSVTRDPVGRSSGIRPYRSRTESGYLRGVAIETYDSALPLGLRGDLFLSRRFLDGSVEYELDETGGTGYPTALLGSADGSGLLAARTDIRRDDRIEERLAGLRIERVRESGGIGMTFVTSTLRARAFDSIPAQPIESSTLAGISFDGRIGPSLLFGEIAHDAGNGSAANGGISTSVGTLALTIAGRWYSEQFESGYARPFAESPGSFAGERGFYVGGRFRPLSGLTLSLFADHYIRPSGDVRIDRSRNGSDVFVQGSYRPAPGTTVEIAHRSRYRDRVDRGEDPIGVEFLHVVPERLSTSTVRFVWKPRRQPIAIRTEWQHRRHTASPEEPTGSGNLTFVDVRYAADRRFRLGGRISHFFGDRSVRLYTVEQDLPGGLSLLSLGGRGTRFYLIGSVAISRRTTLGLRAELTRYSDRRTISTGSLDEIEGPVRRHVTIGLDWRLDATD